MRSKKQLKFVIYMSFSSFHDQKKPSKHILRVIFTIMAFEINGARRTVWKNVYCFVLLQNVCLLRNIGDFFNESFKICNFVLL